MADLTGKVYGIWTTAWGPMAAVGDDLGIVRVVLPHYQANELSELIPWEHKGVKRCDEAFSELSRLTRDYFNGLTVSFDEITCNIPPEDTFDGMALRTCRKIGYGQKKSYSWIASSIDRPDASRAVASAMGRNRIPLIIPCHRVLYSDGRLGGFSAPGGTDMKKRMLELESRGTSSAL